MSRHPQRVIIASRQSRLAMWQSEFIRDRLRGIYPDCQIEILGMTTRGDEILEVTLAKVGGKGLFVKELESALQKGRADLAVHSAKDVPMELPEGYCIAAITERGDPRDCVVSNRYAALEELPAAAVVGTSSLRREAQLHKRFPAIDVRPLRGNLDTRLAKLDRGEYQAIVLAYAGMKRLGLEGRVRSLLEPEMSLPAPGQAALVIECRADRADLLEMLAPLDHAETSACVRAERAVSRALSGSCQLPLGAFAQISDRELRLRGLVASVDGQRTVVAETRGPWTSPEELGARLAAELRVLGADEILSQLQ